MNPREIRLQGWLVNNPICRAVGAVQHPVFTLSEENRKKAMANFNFGRALGVSALCSFGKVGKIAWRSQPLCFSACLCRAGHLPPLLFEATCYH